MFVSLLFLHDGLCFTIPAFLAAPDDYTEALLSEYIAQATQPKIQTFATLSHFHIILMWNLVRIFLDSRWFFRVWSAGGDEDERSRSSVRERDDSSGT